MASTIRAGQHDLVPAPPPPAAAASAAAAPGDIAGPAPSAQPPPPLSLPRPASEEDLIQAHTIESPSGKIYTIIGDAVFDLSDGSRQLPTGDAQFTSWSLDDDEVNQAEDPGRDLGNHFREWLQQRRAGRVGGDDDTESTIGINSDAMSVAASKAAASPSINGDSDMMAAFKAALSPPPQQQQQDYAALSADFRDLMQRSAEEELAMLTEVLDL